MGNKSIFPSLWGLVARWLNRHPSEVRMNPDNIKDWQERSGLDRFLPLLRGVSCVSCGLGCVGVLANPTHVWLRIIQASANHLYPELRQARRHGERAQPRSELEAINWTERNRTQRETIHPGSITLTRFFPPVMFYVQAASLADRISRPPTRPWQEAGGAS